MAIRLLLLTLALALLVGAPAQRAMAQPAPQPDWQMRQTAHFAARYTSADAYITNKILRTAEASYASVAQALGLGDAVRMHLFVAPDEATFQSLRRGRPRLPKWVGAVAFPPQRLIVLKSPRIIDGHGQDLSVFLKHEISHVLLFHHVGMAGAKGAGIRLPRWFDEGIAMALAREWDMGKRATLLKAALTGALMPLADLRRGFPRHESKAAVAYAQSLSFVGYLIRLRDWQTMQRLIAVLRLRPNLDDALRQVYGVGLRRLESAWRVRIERRYTWVPVVTGGGSIFALSALLVITGFVRKRRAVRAKLREWELEEQAARLARVHSLEDLRSVMDDDDDDEVDGDPEVWKDF